MAAAVAVGLSTFAALPAAAADLTVDDAVFTWGISNEANNRAFAPGTFNFMSAGQAPKTSASDTISESEWSATSGDVTIQKKQADGSYATATWAGLKTTASGATLGQPSAGTFTGHRVAISQGTGTLEPTTDDADISWNGSFTVAYYSGMAQFYVSDPHLVVDGGVGTLTGTLSGFGTSMDNPDLFEQLPTREVTLASLSNVDVTETGVVVTPDYAGVEVAIDPNAASPQVRTGANWGSFPQTFVDYQLLTGQSSYWYSSGGSTDAFKKPLPIEVSYTAEEPPVLTPSITTQPAASGIALGETATFTVAATSPAELSYQWQKSTDGIGWTSIVGATNATYSVAGTSSAVGQYRVIVTANGESVTSEAAALAVTVPTPTVVVSKTSNLDPAGETVTVTGSGFLLNGASTLGTRPPLSGKFTGVYVTFGKYADVWKPTENAATAARSNSDVKWAVSAADIATIGGASSGAIEVKPDGTFETTLVLAKDYAGAPATGNYGVYTYPGGGAKYAAFETYTPITFATPVVSIQTQPTAASSAQGASATFTVAASGTGILSYQWQSSTSGAAFADISGATASSYEATGTTVGSATSYRVVVTDDNGSVTSNAAAHTITAATPTVTVSKTSGIDPAGETVTVTGTGFFPNGTATNGTRPPLANAFTGSYVTFGKYADVWKPTAGAAASARNNNVTKWAVPASSIATIGGANAGAIELKADGTFETTITVKKDYTGAPATGNYGIYTYPGGGATYAAFETYTPLSFAAVVPTAPAAPTATADGTGVTVDWAAPADGGSAITGYTVELTSGSGVVTSQTVSGSTLTASFANLVRGESYTATVVGTNAVGSSTASAASASATIAALAPDAPATPTATAASTTSVSVAWAAPAANGSAITGYSVVVSTGGSVVSTTPIGADTTTAVITGLTRATDYSVTVTATNTVGTSDASEAATVRTPAEAPAEVGTPVATVAGATSVNLGWTAPADGGSAVTGYSVVVLQGGSVVKTVPATGTSVLVDGLTPGTEYTFTVAATNAEGTGSASAESTPVTTFDVADAPKTPTAVLSGSTGIDVSWVAPDETGGTPITGYTVALSSNGSAVGSQTVSADTLTAAFPGLLPGQSYTAQVTANNSVGASDASAASAEVTIPAVAPSTPAAPQASVSGTDVTVTWVAPATGGSAITGYTVALSSNGEVVDTIDVAGDALSTTFSGLGYSASYSATVLATNAVGSSALSEPSGSVVTGGPTAAPATTVSIDELTDDTRNGLSVDPGTVGQDGTVVVSGLKAGEWYFVTAFSEPVQLGWFRADADGEITVALAGVVPGDHHLAVQDVDGGLVGWAAVTVTAAPTTPGTDGGAIVTDTAVAGTTTPKNGSSTLPNTGLEVGGWIALSGMLLAGGLVLLLARRKAAARS
ncbi:fibronectin type III domain-containing protein [Agreia sp. PsM10]|uniref:fibronectin type III domain-containing protein n=1 Tax=Agreia sp. PsM10 TaxID=3030533 RepID=UPI00263AE1C7|nr:fibronectin type III domain-containing protein [Agreia sp. PsM10]MDN4642121.1 fibronectin type III domain-containing protein [Agreia sp. PsM10]